jgi:hypothetical protein
MPLLGSDRGATRVATLSRVFVLLAIIGVFGYDTFACMSTRVSTENDAQNAAYAASQAWHNNPTSTTAVETAYQAAVATVAANPAEQVLTTNFTVDTDGTVHLTLTRTAKTVMFGHIGIFKHWVVASEHGDANSVN